MGFEFAGTSPGNSAENYSAVATDGYNNGPLRLKRTIVCIRHTRYVFLSFLKLGHTQRNLRRDVASATDRRRGTVARLIKLTWPDPAGPLFKTCPFILPTPPYSTPLLPYSPHLPSLFKFHTSPHWSLLPKKPPKPYHYHLLVSGATVGVYLARIILRLSSSPFPRYVSLHFYLFILHFGFVVSISFVLSRILFPLYAYV